MVTLAPSASTWARSPSCGELRKYTPPPPVLPIHTLSGTVSAVAVGAAPLAGAAIAPKAEGLGAPAAGDGPGAAAGEAAGEGTADREGEPDAAVGAATLATGGVGAGDGVVPVHAVSATRH